MAGETPTARWRRELSNLWTYADYPEMGQFTVRYSAAAKACFTCPRPRPRARAQRPSSERVYFPARIALC